MNYKIIANQGHKIVAFQNQNSHLQKLPNAEKNIMFSFSAILSKTYVSMFLAQSALTLIKHFWVNEANQNFVMANDKLYIPLDKMLKSGFQSLSEYYPLAPLSTRLVTRSFFDRLTGQKF